MKGRAKITKTMINWCLQALIFLALTGCSPNDPALDAAIQAFKHRYPDYIVRNSKMLKSDDTTKAVAIDFEGPSNAKNRGHAELLVRKGDSGAWDLVQEKVNMWPQ
jgi:hypothetical protein